MPALVYGLFFALFPRLVCSVTRDSVVASVDVATDVNKTRHDFSGERMMRLVGFHGGAAATAWVSILNPKAPEGKVLPFVACTPLVTRPVFRGAAATKPGLLNAK